MNDEETPVSAEEVIIYPAKYKKPDQANNILMRSLVSLALYLALGFYIFKRWEILLLITAIVMIHELGHFFAMKYFRYKDLGIFFIPLLGAYVSGTKREVSQKQSAVILLAGPLPGIIIGVAFYLIDQHSAGYYLFTFWAERCFWTAAGLFYRYCGIACRGIVLCLRYFIHIRTGSNLKAAVG